MPVITSAMKGLNYYPDNGGVCFGIAAMSAQAVVRHQAETFANRITKIKNLQKEEIKTINKKLEKNPPEYHDLHYFFDGIAIYQNSISPDDRGNIDIFQSLENSKYFVNNENDKTDIPENHNDGFNTPILISKITSSFKLEEFKCFVLELKEKFQDRPLSLFISYTNPNHAVQLGFCNGKWLSVNHDNVKYLGHDSNLLIIRKILVR